MNRPPAAAFVKGLALPALAALAVFAAAGSTGDYVALDFDKLSGYDFPVPEPRYPPEPTARTGPPKLESKIPDDVRAWNGKRVEIYGFMLPLDQDGTTLLVHKFILMRNAISCCFGHANKINEYIMVTMQGKGTPNFTPYVPITVRGTLNVGARFEDGVLSSLYQMNADEVIQQ